MAVQLARDIETNTNASDCLSQKFQQGLQTIEGSLGPDSSLCKQLSSTESRYRHFQESLAAVEPTIGSINTSVKAIRATETDLVQGLEIFGQRLAEAQIPAGNTALEKEALTKFTENTQLQLELQKASIDLESLRKQLSNRVSENEHLQHALTEALTNEQASTSKNSRLCIENTALRGEIQLVEQNVREDFSIASTKSQDRLKADFDRKLKGLETANAKLQANSDQLKSQLVKYQGLLVSLRTSILIWLLMIPRPKKRRQPRLSAW